VKAAGGSAPALVLASGQFHTAELYTIELPPPASTTLRFTTWDAPCTVARQTYYPHLLIKRGSVVQRVGVDVQTLTLDLYPQVDGDTITIAGVPILQACRLGYLDSCRILMSKLFMASPGDVSAGAVPWFQGRVSDVDATRIAARVTIESDMALLNIAMPRNLIQVGCTHRLFDDGCTLDSASWVVAGAVATVNVDRTAITTNLTQANGWFDLGVLTWTSGDLSGLVCAVKSYLNSSGAVTFLRQLPRAPVASDTFTILPGCDKQKATCSGKFSNLTHFRGFPYVPRPETPYSGSTRVHTAKEMAEKREKYNTANSQAGRRRPPGG